MRDDVLQVSVISAISSVMAVYVGEEMPQSRTWTGWKITTRKAGGVAGRQQETVHSVCHRRHTDRLKTIHRRYTVTTRMIHALR